MEDTINHDTFFKFIKYCLVGICNTASTLIIMTCLAYLGFHYVFYTAIAYIITFLLSFTLNFFFTFQKKNHFLKRLFTFIGLNLINLLLVELLQIFLIEYVNLPHYLAIFSGMCFYSVTGFIMNRKYVYNARN